MNKEIKHGKFLPLIAAVVVIAAAVVTLLPKNSGEADAPASSAQSGEIATAASGSDLLIPAEDIGTEASYYDYDANGITVQVLAVHASDGTTRLAFNTCQVCNGSPYAYFVQEGDWFICQNCGNRFASTEVGIVSGGCNPVPITDKIYTEQDGIITIPAAFLEENVVLFRNWKKF